MSRTLLKTCTYGIMHFTVAIIVAYALTRNWRIALAVGAVEPLVQTFAFAVHEKLWSRHLEVRSLPLCGHAHGGKAAIADSFAAPPAAAKLQGVT